VFPVALPNGPKFPTTEKNHLSFHADFSKKNSANFVFLDQEPYDFLISASRFQQENVHEASRTPVLS
jgi:hypothetical protein